MKVSCLTATHGRFGFLREALACFIRQDYADRELIILNNHPIPIICEIPQVYVYNEPGYDTLGACRNRLIKLATGELCRTWDDDDLYLPWAISQGVANIGELDGWKPQRSWFYDGKSYRLDENVYEASITFRTEVVRRVGYKNAGGDEHEPLMQQLRFGKTETVPSYCYRFGCGLWRISGSLGSGTIEERTATWMSRNNDAGNGTSLTPADVQPYYDAIGEAADALGIQ